jgi:hypothetical protein
MMDKLQEIKNVLAEVIVEFDGTRVSLTDCIIFATHSDNEIIFQAVHPENQNRKVQVKLTQSTNG